MYGIYGTASKKENCEMSLEAAIKLINTHLLHAKSGSLFGFTFLPEHRRRMGEV